MPATTLPLPIDPTAPTTRRRVRRPAPYRPSPRVARAAEVLAALATIAATTPTVAELAAALRWPPAELAPVLAALRGSGLVESWQDTDRPGRVRVMLSARALQRLGLALSPHGDRWNPDRPPDGRIRGAGPGDPRPRPR